jgi:hypothetical protein
MRFCLFLILFLAAPSLLKSQGTLQFNQVVTHSGTGSGSWSYNSPSWTVPAGKVWKITSVNAIAGSSANRNLVIDAGGGFANISINDYNPAPIWLKAGDAVRLSAAGNCCSVVSFSYWFSAIEFNVIP